jgi:hypothetical protein
METQNSSGLYPHNQAHASFERGLARCTSTRMQCFDDRAENRASGGAALRHTPRNGRLYGRAPSPPHLSKREHIAGPRREAPVAISRTPGSVTRPTLRRCKPGPYKTVLARLGPSRALHPAHALGSDRERAQRRAPPPAIRTTLCVMSTGEKYASAMISLCRPHGRTISLAVFVTAPLI